MSVVTIDYAGIFTTLTNQVLTAISATLPVVIPIIGVMSAIGIGKKLFKKFAGA